MAKNSELQRSPIHLLHRAGQCAEDIFHAEIKEADLTPRQLAVLITVAGNEGGSQTAIVERTGVDRSTLADIVRRLQKKGLLQRRRTKEDARAYAVKLTDAGRRVLNTNLQDLLAAQGAIIEHAAAGDITPSEAHTMAALLDLRRRTIETCELEERLAALESRMPGGASR